MKYWNIWKIALALICANFESMKCSVTAELSSFFLVLSFYFQLTNPPNRTLFLSCLFVFTKECLIVKANHYFSKFLLILNISGWFSVHFTKQYINKSFWSFFNLRYGPIHLSHFVLLLLSFNVIKIFHVLINKCAYRP